MKGCNFCLICLEGLRPLGIRGRKKSSGNKKNVTELLLSYLVGSCKRPGRNKFSNSRDDYYVLKLVWPVEGECNLDGVRTSLRLCDWCGGAAAKVLELHLELEKIQMTIVEEIRRVRELVLRSSEWLEECEGEGKEVRTAYETFCKKFSSDDDQGSGMREVFEAVREFQQAVCKADQNSVRIPLVYVESFEVGKYKRPVVSTEDVSDVFHVEEEELDWQEVEKKPEPQPFEQDSYSSPPTPTPSNEDPSFGSEEEFVPPLKKRKARLQSWKGEKKRSFLWGSSPPPEDSTEDYQPKSDQDRFEVPKYKKPVASPKDMRNVTSVKTKKEIPPGRGKMRRSRQPHRLLGSSSPPPPCLDEDFERQSSNEDWVPQKHKPTPTSGASDSEEEPIKSVMSSKMNSLQDDPTQTGCRRKKVVRKRHRDFYRCKSCNFSIRSATPSAFEEHLRSHETDCELKQFQCDQCAQAFSTEQHRLFHQQQHNGLHKLKCDVCSEHVPALDLLTHLKSHKDGDVDPEEILQCERCSQWSSLWEKRRRHVVNCHPGISLICDMCGKTFASMKEIEKHFYHNHQIQYKCKFEGCDKAFASKGHLNVHLKSHIGAFTCKECGKTLANHHSFRAHELTHVPVEERPFHCDQCPKVFCSDSSLAGHIKQAHGDKPDEFKCDQCGKECVSKAALRAHWKKEHADGDQAFKCLLCDRRFDSRTRLKSHMEAHAGEKKYMCEECGKGFSVHRNYLSHKMTHGEKKFKCPRCPLAFPMTKYLKEHMRTHTGEKPFVCPKCGNAFTQAGSLLRHKKSCQPIPIVEVKVEMTDSE